MSRDLERRDFLSRAGTVVGAAAVAGCPNGEGTPTGTDEAGRGGDGVESRGSTETDLPEPETRVDYLERANRALHELAPWVFLHRQYSVYGKSTTLDWEPRRDETIDASAIEPGGEQSTVRITQSGTDSGLDPHDHRETITDNVVRQAYEGLLGRDREGRIVEALATGYERVDPGTVRFDLRSGVTFHSGDSLTAADVAYSINRVVQSGVGGLESPQSDQLGAVTGAEPAGESGAVVVSSAGGSNPVVFGLFATYCDVVNRSWVEAHDSAYINAHADGTGPFRLADYDPGESVTFERYDEYWGEGAPAAALEIAGTSDADSRVDQLLGGETDVVVNVPPRLIRRVREAETATVDAVPSTRVIFCAMVADREPFDSADFRRAMNYAVDLDGVVARVLSGFADQTSQPTLAGFTGYNADLNPYPYDPDAAERLVAESGYAGAELELHAPNGRYLKDVEVARAVAAHIDDLEAVSCSVTERDFDALSDELLYEEESTGPAFYLVGWGNATFDASQTIRPLLTSDGTLTSLENDRVDDLMQQARDAGGADSAD